jgi:hypothetical protein
MPHRLRPSTPRHFRTRLLALLGPAHKQALDQRSSRDRGGAASAERAERRISQAAVIKPGRAANQPAIPYRYTPPPNHPVPSNPILGLNSRSSGPVRPASPVPLPQPTHDSEPTPPIPGSPLASCTQPTKSNKAGSVPIKAVLRSAAADIAEPLLRLARPRWQLPEIQISGCPGPGIRARKSSSVQIRILKMTRNRKR